MNSLNTTTEDPGILFHCLSTKQKFTVQNPEMIKTSHGRWFYVAPSPYATHSAKTGNALGQMYRAVPKWRLQEMAANQPSVAQKLDF